MGGCLSKKDQDPGIQPKSEGAEGAAPKTEETAEGTGGDATAAVAATEPDCGDKVQENTAAKSEEAPGSPAKPVVFVLGASGKIGSATLKFLSEEFTDKVEIRAGVRHPDRADKLKALPGITVVQASMPEKDNLVAVLAEIDVLYIVSPGAENRVELCGIAADAAKEVGVKHIAIVSGAMAGEEGIIFGIQFGEIENMVTGLGIPHTILRLPLFMDSLLGSAETVRETGQFSNPASGDKPYLLVDPDDAGKASAVVLADPSKHAGKTYEIVSDRVTNDRIASALSSALEKEITFVKSEMANMKQDMLSLGLPARLADGSVQLFKLIEEGSPLANPENIGDFKEITGEEPKSVEEFLTRHAALFIK